jgi:K+-sensing histidine kinase KdpD
MGYLVCKKCRGYYKLQSGEYSTDFTDKCACGGKLRYAHSIDIVGENKTFQSKQRNTEQNKKKENKKTTKKSEKSPVVVAVINLLIAGLGFVYIDDFTKAIVSFLFVVIVGYLFGLILSLGALLIVMFWAYDETNKYNQNLG